MVKCANCQQEYRKSILDCPNCGEKRSLDDDTTWRVHPTSSAGPTSATCAIGQKVGDRYEILRHIGSGTFGEVFQARDTELKRDVAMKFLRKTVRDGDMAIKKFYDEVATALELTHVNLCRVYDVGKAGERVYFTMQYVPGKDLRIHLKDTGRLERNEALEITLQICEGLLHLHTKGYLHRDLKPANMLKDPGGRVYITDYGLVGRLCELEQGDLVGTHPYIAPEILRGETATEQSDIFSLGVSLYELTVGRKPFRSNTPSDLLTEIRKGCDRPSAVIEDFDSDLQNLILSCIKESPQHRPPNVKDIMLTVEKLQRHRTESHDNPFVAGRAVRDAEFINRTAELRILFGAIEQGTSAFIYGDPQTGKTSLLSRIKNEMEAKGDNALPVWVDLRTMRREYSPNDFWRSCFASLRNAAVDTSIAQQMASTEKNDFKPEFLASLFETFGKDGRTVVLLLDGFERLPDLPNFGDNFAACIRSLTDRCEGIVIVFASSLPVGCLDTSVTGYYRYFRKINLEPFNNRAVDEILDRGLFSPIDRNLIRCLAGRHPMLLQAAALIRHEDGSEEQRITCAVRFYSDVFPYFDQLWCRWDAHCRSTAIVMGFVEWAHRIAHSEIAGRDVLSKRSALNGSQEMEKLGLLGNPEIPPHRTIKHEFPEFGKQLAFCCEVFLWWIWDVAVSRHREFDDVQSWISSPWTNSLKSKDTWEKLQSSLGNCPERSMTVEDLAQSFVRRFTEDRI